MTQLDKILHKNTRLTVFLARSYTTKNEQPFWLPVSYKSYGAGDGNRTHATSLEGWSSTIELHPQEKNNHQTLLNPTI
jgi:hypothetical protein